MLSARNILKTLRQKYNPFYSFRDFSLSITPSWFYRNLFILKKKKKTSFTISAIDETQHSTIWGRHEHSDDRYSDGYFLTDIEFVVDLTFISAHNIFISFSSFLHFFLKNEKSSYRNHCTPRGHFLHLLSRAFWFVLVFSCPH